MSISDAELGRRDRPDQVHHQLLLRVTRFVHGSHAWGYACYRELLYDGAGVAVEMTAT
jgi:hypothetical protein